MRTKFRILVNKVFVEAYIVKRGDIPLPDGVTDKDALKRKIEGHTETELLEFYFYVDDSPLPLNAGDIVWLGIFKWKVIGNEFDFNTNTLIIDLIRN